MKKTALKFFSLICMAILCFAMVAGGLFMPSESTENSANAPSGKYEVETESLAREAELNEKYAAFSNGSTYTFTDKSKMEAFREGTIESDQTTVTVDRTQPHGSQKNPYVIESMQGWKIFASDMTQANSYGAGKYFVLANDLDFASEGQAPLISGFSGSFYGLGHTISNIKFAEKKDSYGFVIGGLFNWLYGNTEFADISVFNYTSNGSGGLIGASDIETGGDCYISNCHTQGSVALEANGWQGGIIAYFNSNSKLTVYKCSAKVMGSVIPPYGYQYSAGIGGIIGQMSNAGTSSVLHVYDCYADVDGTCSSSGDAVYCGVLLGFLNVYSFDVENIAGRVHITGESRYGYDGTLCSAYSATYRACGTWSIKNSYLVAEYVRSAGTYRPFFVGSYNKTAGNFNGDKVAENVHYTSDLSATLPSEGLNNGSEVFSGLSGLTREEAGPDVMWEAAKKDETFRSDIWDKTKIGTQDAYTDSPVRKQLKTSDFTVQYRNLKINSGKEETEEIAGAENVNYDHGNTIGLAEPTSAENNHVFKGWTTDKSGNSEPYLTLPENMYGDVVLYAVWDFETVTESVKAKDGIDTVEYGLGKVTLQADVTATGIQNRGVTYAWFRGEEQIGTGSEWTLSDVKESGEYSVKYLLYDQDEPLWRRSGKTTDTVTATITKGTLQLENFSIDESTVAYFGKPIGEVLFSVTVKNGAGSVVNGTAKWRYETGKVQEGENTIEVAFVPDDTENYEAVNYFEVTFESEYVTLTFDIPKLTGKFSVNLEYGQNYSANKIREMFNVGFKAYLEENPSASDAVKDMTPQLNGTDIDEYVNVLENVTENQVITVTLVEKEYEVQFDAKNDTPITTKKYKYGNYILEPTKPENAGQAFLGWYYEKTTDEGPVETKWDFETDVVTEDLTLYAKWLNVNYVLDSIKVTVQGSFNALEEVKEGDLTVTATLKDDSGMYMQEVELSWGDYKILYGGDGLLHAPETQITVEYEYGGVTKSEVVTLSVNPKKISTDGLTFKNKTVVFDGNKQTIVVVGSLPTEITGVSYEYYKGKDLVSTDGVTDIGTYTVKAVFTLDGDDYAADPMTATLTITRQAASVTLHWESTGFTYNGQEQIPQVRIEDEEGNDLTDSLQFRYEIADGKNATDAGRYKVKVIIETSGYEISGDDFIEYEISKKALSVPSFVGGLTYDGTEKIVSDHFENFESAAFDLGQDVKASNAGKYRVTVTLADTSNYEWSTDSGVVGNTVTIDWSIEKAQLTAEWNGFEFLYQEGQTYRPRVNRLAGIVAADEGQINYETDLFYTGDAEVAQVGAYQVNVSLNEDAAWARNYELVGNVAWNYVVVPKSGMTIITVKWSETEFVYNGEVQSPTYKIYDQNGEELSGIELEIVGDHQTSKWAGEYRVTVTPKDADRYFIREGSVCVYYIREGENGEGGINDPNNPNNPNNPDNPDDPDQGGDGGFRLPEGFPLWQSAVGALSIVLGAIFFIKTGKNASNIKKLKNKTEKLNPKSYSFGGITVALLVSEYLGLSANVWTIIACSLAGLCVIGFISMLVTGHKRKRAEEAYERAQEEKQEREAREREENQRRRDEELKMVLMAMMNGGNRANGTASNGTINLTGTTIEEIVSRTVAAMLPAVQKLMLSEKSSVNDETVVKLLEQQEKLIQKILEHPTVVENRVTDEEKEPDEEEKHWDEESDEEVTEEVTEEPMEGEVAATDSVTVKVKTIVKLPPNFRARLKISSEKNRETYVKLKNELNSWRGVTFRVCGRVEKVKYHGELIAVVGVATKSLKLWLALDPKAYDEKRYFQKDVSDKVRYEKVPMLVRLGSERAQKRGLELLEQLRIKIGTEKKTRYEEKDLQELAYTLKNNALLKMHKQEMLRESIHVHDADALTDEEAEASVERREIGALGEEHFATIKLDVLDENFGDGQKVTLEALKKKGLADEECNGFKVLAGNRLSKPLIVLANEFSTAAAKMIVLTGGRAILLIQPFQPKFS